MTVKTTPLGGADWTNGGVLYSADLNDTFDAVGLYSSQLISSRQVNTVVAGTWAHSINTDNMLNIQTGNTSHDQNDELSYKVFLQSGTYTLYMRHNTFSNRGIFTVYIDGVSVGTIDGYSAGNVEDVESTIASISVTASGLKSVNFKIATKNASSSDYAFYFSAFWFIKTA